MPLTPLPYILAKAAEGAYGDDSAVIGKLVGLFMAAKFEQSWGPFICGTMGVEGSDGLHDGYLICPAYGADVQCTAHFSRTKPVTNGHQGGAT